MAGFLPFRCAFFLTMNFPNPLDQDIIATAGLKKT
jgi:hypothetical protein